jgi:hypothetical protein
MTRSTEMSLVDKSSNKSGRSGKKMIRMTEAAKLSQSSGNLNNFRRDVLTEVITRHNHCAHCSNSVKKQLKPFRTVPKLVPKIGLTLLFLS